MNSVKITSRSPEETIKVAQRLVKYLDAGSILCLFGGLGAGKTTFVKGLAKALRVKSENVHSPTFVLMNVYEGRLPLYHFDFYRLEKVEEIGVIGYEEFLYGEGIAVIEWAERFGSLMPQEYLKVQIVHQGANKRELRISFHGKRYQRAVGKLS